MVILGRFRQLGILATGFMVAVVVALLPLVAAPEAAAHATRIGADPAEGSSLSTGPDRVSATFNEKMQDTFAAMTVVGPDGNLWSTGDPLVEDAVISVAVRPLGPAGTYTVNYRATSADGHVVTGSWSFELTTPGPGEPGPTVGSEPATQSDQSDADSGSDTGQGSGLPVWPFAAGAALIVAGGALWAVRRRR